MTPNPQRGGGLFTEGRSRRETGADSSDLYTQQKTPRVTERSFTSLARLFPEYEGPCTAGHVCLPPGRVISLGGTTNTCNSKIGRIMAGRGQMGGKQANILRLRPSRRTRPPEVTRLVWVGVGKSMFQVVKSENPCFRGLTD